MKKKDDNQPKRVPVDFIYQAVNPDFLKMLARIGSYANEKYGSWSQYTGARLVGEKSPINHAYEHLRAYQMGEKYDHFDGDVGWHLVAVAYNVSMELFYLRKFGHLRHPLAVDGGILTGQICTLLNLGLENLTHDQRKKLAKLLNERNRALGFNKIRPDKTKKKKRS